MSQENAQPCERTEDLISFLYGDLGEAERRSFDQHRANCPSCDSEIRALGPIRRSIVAWRDQSLGIYTESEVRNSIAAIGEQPRSALAALRSFFDLSPIWLKGATAAATLLFCLLAGVGAAGLLEDSGNAWIPPVAVSTPDWKSEADRQRIIENEIQKRLEAAVAGMSQPAQPTRSKEFTSGQTRAVAQTERKNYFIPKHDLRKPLTRAERERLAADLRLIPEEDEDLLQLLGDRVERPSPR